MDSIQKVSDMEEDMKLHTDSLNNIVSDNVDANVNNTDPVAQVEELDAKDEDVSSKDGEEQKEVSLEQNDAEDDSLIANITPAEDVVKHQQNTNGSAVGDNELESGEAPLKDDVVSPEDAIPKEGEDTLVSDPVEDSNVKDTEELVDSNAVKEDDVAEDELDTNVVKEDDVAEDELDTNVVKEDDVAEYELNTNVKEDDTEAEVVDNSKESVNNPEKYTPETGLVNDSVQDDSPETEDLADSNVVQQDVTITPETEEFPQKNELNPIIPQEEDKDVEPTNNVDAFLKSTNNEVIPQFSDDEIDEAAMSSESESGPPTSPEIDSGSDSDYQISSQDEAEKDDDDLEEEEDGDAIVGPIVSKNEINEMAPVLPPGFAIPPNAPIELVGKITGLVDNSVIIEANVSGEFRTLKESSIFCFQDRSIVGPLFETFGRLQSPRYRVKFNTVEEFGKYVDSVGRDVYYVVPESQFLYTDSIKVMKGTDASNCHDEELPEEEQEFSDDENEAQAKNKRKKKNKKTNDNDESRKRSRVEQPPAGNKFQPYGYAAPSSSVSTYTPINKSGIPTNMQQVPQGQYAGSYSPNIPQLLPPQLLGGNFAPQGQNPNFQQPNYPQQQQQQQQPQLQNNFQLGDGYASPYGIPLHQAQQHGMYPPPQQGMYPNMNHQQQFQQGYPQQSYQQQFQQPYQQGYPQQQLHQLPQYPPQGQIHPNQQMHQMGNQNQGQNQNQNYQPPYPQQPPK